MTDRNIVTVDNQLPPYTFRLTLGTHVELTAEIHDGTQTVLVLRRRPTLTLLQTQNHTTT